MSATTKNGCHQHSLFHASLSLFFGDHFPPSPLPPPVSRSFLITWLSILRFIWWNTSKTLKRKTRYNLYFCNTLCRRTDYVHMKERDSQHVISLLALSEFTLAIMKLTQSHQIFFTCLKNINFVIRQRNMSSWVLRRHWKEILMKRKHF